MRSGSKQIIWRKIIAKRQIKRKIIIVAFGGLMIGAWWGYNEAWDVSAQSVQKEDVSIVMPQVEETVKADSEHVLSNSFLVAVQTKSGEIIQQELEEYVCNVVAAEMPAHFASEALKAQAVAARSYCVHYLSGKPYIPAGTIAQDWISSEEQKERWGSNYDIYREKIALAVNETKGEVLYWQNAVITAAYHASCGGRKTASAKEVWGGEVAYLQSVDCPHGADKHSGVEHIFTKEEIARAIGVDGVKDVQIKSYTNSGRVDGVLIDGIEYDIGKIRTSLSLPSGIFTVNIKEEKVIITSYGSGHGVGMCQYGAEYYAKEGWDYQQILQHFYPETTLGWV